MTEERPESITQPQAAETRDKRYECKCSCGCQRSAAAISLFCYQCRMRPYPEHQK